MRAELRDRKHTLRALVTPPCHSKHLSPEGPPGARPVGSSSAGAMALRPAASGGAAGSGGCAELGALGQACSSPGGPADSSPPGGFRDPVPVPQWKQCFQEPAAVTDRAGPRGPGCQVGVPAAPSPLRRESFLGNEPPTGKAPKCPTKLKSCYSCRPLMNVM